MHFIYLWCINFFCYILTFLLAILYPHVGLVFSIIGATCANILAYIAPAAIFMKLNKPNTIWYLALVQAIIGVISMVCGVTGYSILLARS